MGEDGIYALMHGIIGECSYRSKPSPYSTKSGGLEPADHAGSNRQMKEKCQGTSTDESANVETTRKVSPFSLGVKVCSVWAKRGR